MPPENRISQADKLGYIVTDPDLRVRSPSPYQSQDGLALNVASGGVTVLCRHTTNENTTLKVSNRHGLCFE